ncbi:MAG TPA: hypothetical protein VNZ45_11425 [Bacteroidia bacterium]|jgi:hypothetical protein|nr:hypothetical protein [Bacteroidia bacterium]
MKAKKPKPKAKKKRANHYEKKLAIKGKFIDVIRLAVNVDKKKE